MKRLDIVERGDWVSLFSHRNTAADNLIKRNTPKSKDPENTELIFVVIRTEVHIVNGHEELFVVLNDGDKEAVLPAFSIWNLYQRELFEKVNENKWLPIIFVTFLNFSNFIDRNWTVDKSFVRVRTYGDTGIIIPYHLIDDENWKSEYNFRLKLYKERENQYNKKCHIG